MPILTLSGRVAIAQSIAIRPLHLAWGGGDGDWTSPPSEDSEATALQDEIGRRTAAVVGYAIPDEDGDIVIPTGTFSVSETPTNHLLMTFNFDFDDAPSDVVREVGVFVGSVMVDGLPGGQEYFVPAEVDEPGTLLHLENIAPIFRSPAVRENFTIIVTF